MPPRTLKKLRIFLASPSDLFTEREIVKKVIQGLNEVGLAEQCGFTLEALDWYTHVSPLMGRPEGVVLQELPVESWDVFIGALWHRFGTPTGALDHDTGQAHFSGTEEEFSLAYRAWKSGGRPTILFYRCTRSLRVTDMSGAQYQRVEDFCNQFKTENGHPGLYSEFEDLTAFALKVNKDLTKLLYTFAKRAEPSPSVAVIDDLGPDACYIQNELKQGESYDLALLSVDIVDHSKLVSNSSRVKMTQLLDEFERLVFSVIREPRLHGDTIDWSPDGGLFAFWGPKRCDRAVQAAFSIQQGVERLNLDSDRNPLRRIQIRLSATAGLVEFRMPPSRISAESLNLVSKLQKNGTPPGEFRLTELAYRELSERLKATFSYSGGFEGVAVYQFDPRPRRERPTEAELTALVKKVNEAVEALLTSPKPSFLKNVSANVDLLYSSLETFCRCFELVEEQWSSEYFLKVSELTSRLLSSELRLWNMLRSLSTQVPEGPGDRQLLQPILEIASSRRAVSFVDLVRLKVLFDMHISKKKPLSINTTIATSKSLIPQITPLSRTNGFDQKVQFLTKADDLQEESAFTDILTNSRDALIEVISAGAPEETIRSLAEKLWSHADLLYLEENDRTKKNPGTEPALIMTLARNEVLGGRYRALNGLIARDHIPTSEDITQAFKSEGIELTPGDDAIIGRCLLVCHRSGELRNHFAAILPMNQLWRTIAYPRVPVRALLATGTRLAASENNDNRKIFFDCTRSRLLRAIKEDDDEWPEIEALIANFFDWDFFVETAYFERLEELLRHFRTKAEGAGLRLEYFDHIMSKIRQLREECGNPDATIPKGIEILPLAIQRHLAREGCHVDYFVLHPEYRIAGETRIHINLGNIERILTYRQINGQLFSELLKRREFFTRPSTSLVVLNHPKCEVAFASAHIARLDRRELGKLAGNVNANPAVRSLARVRVQ